MKHTPITFIILLMFSPFLITAAARADDLDRCLERAEEIRAFAERAAATDTYVETVELVREAYGPDFEHDEEAAHHIANIRVIRYLPAHQQAIVFDGVEQGALESCLEDD